MKKTRNPRTILDPIQLKAFMRLNPSLKDTAAFFDCSIETVETRIKEGYNLSFPEFRDQNMVETRKMLIRTALKQARTGNTAMLIFCLKNLCGWKDRHEVTGKDDAPMAPQIIVTLPDNGRDKK